MSNNKSIADIMSKGRNQRIQETVDFTQFDIEELRRDAIECPYGKFLNSGFRKSGGRTYKWISGQGRVGVRKTFRGMTFQKFMNRPLVYAWTYNLWDWLQIKPETVAWLCTLHIKKVDELDREKRPFMKKAKEDALFNIQRNDEDISS